MFIYKSDMGKYGQDIEKILARCEPDMWKIMLKVSASSKYFWPRCSQKTDVYCKSLGTITSSTKLLRQNISLKKLFPGLGVG